MTDGKTWRDQISTDVGELKSDVKALAKSHGEFRKEMMGNGQKGIVRTIFDQLRSLWRLVWIGYGILIAVSILTAIFSSISDKDGTLLLHILKTLAR